MYTKGDKGIGFYTSMTKGAFKGLDVNFIGKRKVTYVISAIIIAVGFYLISRFGSGSFLPFIIYEAVVMLFALIAYSVLLKRKFAGAGYMVLGILITIIAAVIQATKAFQLTLIWEFDHNGIFHLVQIPGVIFLYLGLKTELSSR